MHGGVRGRGLITPSYSIKDSFGVVIQKSTVLIGDKILIGSGNPVNVLLYSAGCFEAHGLRDLLHGASVHPHLQDFHIRGRERLLELFDLHFR